MNPEIQPDRMINFTDPQLQKCFESKLTEAGGVSGELRQVSALIAVHNSFRMLEGPHSSRVPETIWQLLLPKLRPQLRRWYQRLNAEKNSETVDLGDCLNQLAGERLERRPTTPREPA